VSSNTYPAHCVSCGVVYRIPKEQHTAKCCAIYGDVTSTRFARCGGNVVPTEEDKHAIKLDVNSSGWLDEIRRVIEETRHTELQRTLRRIEHRLDLIFHTEKRIMGAVEDAVSKLNGISDEADAIKAGVQSIEAAQSTGDQATIDAAVNAAVATINAAADNTKAHVDAALAAVQAGLPAAPADPSQPTG
jgi:hypothetical protein